MAQITKQTVKGSLMSLRSLGISATLLELLRRVLKVRYRINGVVVNDSNVFRNLRKLALKGYRVYARSNYLYIDAGWALFRAPLRDARIWSWLMAVLAEDIEEFYGCLSVEGNVVLDIGAFMGETSCFFAKRGARIVHAYEPVKEFYEVLVDNVRLNRLDGRIIPHNYGVWISDGEIPINLSGGGSGLDLKREALGEECLAKVRAMHLAKVINVVSDTTEGSDIVAKFDCEGCEYALLSIDREVIRKVREYVIEIHGAYLPIVHRMLECGYAAKLVKKFSDNGVPLTIWHFRRRKTHETTKVTSLHESNSPVNLNH